jgi:hypothetical protein
MEQALNRSFYFLGNCHPFLLQSLISVGACLPAAIDAQQSHTGVRTCYSALALVWLPVVTQALGLSLAPTTPLLQEPP